MPYVLDGPMHMDSVLVEIAQHDSSLKCSNHNRSPGLNIDVGRAGVFSPAFVVPILIGNGQGGTADDPSNVLVGLEFQAGFTTTF